MAPLENVLISFSISLNFVRPDLLQFELPIPPRQCANKCYAASCEIHPVPCYAKEMYKNYNAAGNS